MSTEFQREDRYIVIKRSDLDRLPSLQRHLFSQASRRAHEQMFAAGAPARMFLVIESDWPEYEPSWAAIEARVNGKPAEQHQGNPGEVERLRKTIHGMNDAHAKVVASNAELRAKLAEQDALLRNLIQIAEDREQGYAGRLHGAVVNGKAADSLVMLMASMKLALSSDAEPSAPASCTWLHNENSFAWDTTCNESFLLMDDGPKENCMKFCCYCSKPIIQAPREAES